MWSSPTPIRKARDQSPPKCAAAAAGRSGIALDAGDETHWHAAIEAGVDDFGQLDALDNDADVGATRSFLEASRTDWRAVMRVNLDGVFLGPRLGVEAMRSHPSRQRRCPGSIVNILSVLGIVGFAEAAPYCASKGGVRLLTKADALESAAKAWDIRVNSVHPGCIWTLMVRETIRRSAAETGVVEEAPRQGLPNLHPLGRLRSLEEVAAAVLYVASDESSFVTGAELTIDGGYTAR